MRARCATVRDDARPAKETEMLYLLVGLVLAAVVLGGLMWLTFSLVGLVLTLFMAGLVGWAADAVIPGRLPGGWLGAVLAGIIGGFIGTLALGRIGPTIFDINIIPAFIGAAAIAVVAELALGSRSRAVR